MTLPDTTKKPLHIRVSDVLARHGKPPWAEALLEDGRNMAVLICNDPGQTNDAHVHPDFQEWWIIMKGELVWETGDYAPITARFGDIIYCPRGLRHFISTIGKESSLRLGVTKPDSDHSVKGTHGQKVLPLPKQQPPNMLHSSLKDIVKSKGTPPWSVELVLDERNRANLICQLPGQSNKPHSHPDFDEWWAILQGELIWEVGNFPPIHAKAGDIVFAPAGPVHGIKTVGTQPSLRLAVTPPRPVHIYAP